MLLALVLTVSVLATVLYEAPPPSGKVIPRLSRSLWLPSGAPNLRLVLLGCPQQMDQQQPRHMLMAAVVMKSGGTRYDLEMSV